MNVCCKTLVKLLVSHDSDGNNQANSVPERSTTYIWWFRKVPPPLCSSEDIKHSAKILTLIFKACKSTDHSCQR